MGSCVGSVLPQIRKVNVVQDFIRCIYLSKFAGASLGPTVLRTRDRLSRDMPNYKSSLEWLHGTKLRR